jgi:K+-transporting ATPase ATPase C chain
LTTKDKVKSNYRPLIGIAIISMVICGLFFPLIITGLGQVLFPYQANGELARLNDRNVGSYLIDNNFTLPIFFHARNNSASGVDPDITVQDAYSQIPRIQNATGIAAGALRSIVDQNTEGTFWVFGSPYVDVLRVNLALIGEYPSVYAEFH